MEHGIFITENGWDAIARAYPQDIREELEQQIAFLPGCLKKDALQGQQDALKEVTVAFSTWGMPCLTEEEIQRIFPNLKAVFYAAGSVQRFARPFLSCGVRIFCAAQANAVPVAKYTVAQILLANKGYFPAVGRCKNGWRSAHEVSASFPGNMDCKVGIIGAGAIGKLVISLLKPFDLEILVFDPFLPEQTAQAMQVRKVDLQTLFRECQTISNHLANNPQTVGMLHYGLFSLMKPNATFINTGRGAQVVEADLCRAMEEAPNRTALLDVTFPEPPLPDSPLWKLDNIHITPHIAGSMSHEIGRMGRYMLRAYEDYRDANPCALEVTAQMLTTMA